MNYSGTSICHPGEKCHGLSGSVPEDGVIVYEMDEDKIRDGKEEIIPANSVVLALGMQSTEDTV